MNNDGFTAILHELDPDVSYNIQATTGGVVNVTVRATKTSEDATKGRFAGHSSLIIKYAPPYIAKIGEAAPFDQHRQVIEARALALFNPSSPAGLQDIANTTQTKVPELLFHDPRKHILIVADLGSYPDISELFSSLGGYHPTLEPSTLSPKFFRLNELHAIQRRYFRDLGQQVGSFFAHLHKPETRNRIPDPLLFDNPDKPRLLLEHVTNPAIELIRRHLISDEDRASLCAGIMLDEAQRPLREDEKSFVLGDCWTSALLISLPDAKVAPLVGVIDWEFAAFGRGVHGDMAQLMAHLEMLRVSAAQHPQFNAQLDALNELVKSMSSAYSGRPRERSLEGTLRAIKMRSAFITCGTEMVSCAEWKKWVCVDPSCPSDHTEGRIEECLQVKRITEVGINFILLACKDIKTFCSDAQWHAMGDFIQHVGGNEEKWLLDFF